MTQVVTARPVDQVKPSELGLCLDCLRDDGTVMDGLCTQCFIERQACDTRYRLAEAAWQEALRALMAARYADADTQQAALARCSRTLAALR